MKYHYQKYMKKFIIQTGKDRILAHHPEALSLYDRMLASRYSGNKYKSFLYLFACYLKELSFILPLIIGFILYLLIK